MKPRNLVKVIDVMRYKTSLSTLIASDERDEESRFLFRTKNSRYFVQCQTTDRESDDIVPVFRWKAAELYTEFPLKEMGFEKALPWISIVDA